MEDVTPQLIEKVRTFFFAELDKNQKINALYKKVRDGTANYRDANQFAVLVGNALAKSFKLNISADVLPDGRMYYNIAERLLNTLLKDEHKIVASMGADVQRSVNKAAGLGGIGAIIPDADQKRIDGIIERIADELDFSKIEWILGEPVVNLAQHSLTETIRENARLLNNLGATVTITRTLGRSSHDKSCKWCRALAGVYNYEDVSDSGSEVYMRHDNCRCEVESNVAKMRASGHAFVRA